MKLGRDTASLTNAIMGNFSGQPEPTVGMGVTISFYTDRAAGTILVATPKRIIIQEDEATRIDSNGMSENQQYEYQRNPHGRVLTFTKRRNGKWTEAGEKAGHGPGVTFGIRQAYHDFSF